MPLTFIRHGEKKYPNGKNIPGYPAHDPPLKENQEAKIKKITVDLISKYGKPEIIISSPFERTRQTSKIMQQYILKIYDYNCDIEIEKNIEEFLGHQKPAGLEADLYKDTSYYTKPKIGVEKVEQCRERIINFYHQLDKKRNIWFITHGILMHFVYKDAMKRKKNFNYLEYFSLPPSVLHEFVNKNLP